MIDVAIIGGGPAGLSCAINVAARNKSCVVLARNMETSWLYKAEDVNNHLGMPHMTGQAMTEAFYKHAKQMNIEIREGRVLQVMPMGDYFMINFESEFVEAKRLVLATGVEKGKTIPGESEFLGRGVSYCATCDGMLYRGKDVFVSSQIPEGSDDVAFLAGLCNRVYYHNNYDDNRDYGENVTKVTEKPKEIFGELKVNALVAGDKYNVDGVFLIKPTTPIGSLVPGLETDGGMIPVDRFMRTNIPGLYACGDCTGWPLQLSKAIGEGLVAGQHAVKSLDEVLS